MSFTFTCNCCGHKQELTSKPEEAPIKYFFLPAAEELMNESICAIEDREVRRIRVDDNKDKVVFVYVSNPIKSSGSFRIEKGDLVRYRVIN